MSDAFRRQDEDSLPLATAEAEATAGKAGATKRALLARVANGLARPPLPVTLLVCAAILVARKPDAVLRPQLWAEDGTEFYRDGLVNGWTVLFKPFVDYLHLIPRIVGAIVGRLDPAIAPTLFVAAAMGLTLYVAGLTQSTRMPFRPHLGFALAVVLVPDSAETLLCICNLQWIIAAALVLVLIARDPATRLQRWHDGIAAMLLGLTGPFSILVAPLYWWRAWSRRTTVSTLLAAIVTACAAAQTAQILHAGALSHPGSSPISAIWRVIGMRVTASLVVGKWVPIDYPASVEVALGFITLAGVAVLAWHRGESRLERRWVALAFLSYSAAALFRVKHVLLEMCHPGSAARYVYLPQLMVLWLLLVVAGGRRRGWAWAAAGLVVGMTATNLPRVFNYPPVPNQHWEKYVAPLRSGQAVDVPVNPQGWIMRVPARVAAPGASRP